MAKVKYYAKENSSIGTHSFYAVPIPIVSTDTCAIICAMLKLSE